MVEYIHKVTYIYYIHTTSLQMIVVLLLLSIYNNPIIISMHLLGDITLQLEKLYYIGMKKLLTNY